MRAVKRLHARSKKTACEYTHLQVWVWDACNLHKPFNYNSLNVCTETIGFTTIRKIVDEHKLITAIYWVSYELEMRVSRLRRLTCTASTFLKRFLPIAWVDLKSEYTDFKMRFLKKKNCEALPRSQSLMLRWKILMCFLKFVARRVTKFFLMSVL